MSMQASNDVEARSAGESQNQVRNSMEHSTVIANLTIVGDGEDPVIKYGDTSATYWKLYESEAATSDNKYIERLRGDMNSMVLLNSMFSSIVASFIIEIYKTLLPDNGQRTVDLLSQLVLLSNTSHSTPPANPDNQSSDTPGIAIRINIVLYLSFFLSTMSAVACALIQQWCNEYLSSAFPRAAPHECGRVRTYLYRGLTRFQMRRFMYGTHVLLHILVFLFFWSLSDFYSTIHISIGNVSRYCLVASIIVYLTLSIFPLIFGDAPYNTPLTLPLRACGMLILHSFQIVLWHRQRDAGKSLISTLRQDIKGLRFDRANLFMVKAKKWAADLERYAMEWLLSENDFSDRDMDIFLEGLPGYISSRLTVEEKLDTYIANNYVLERIREHLLTCATSLELSDEQSIARASCCIKSLRLIFGHSIKSNQNSSDSDDKNSNRQMMYIGGIFDYLQALCMRAAKDPVVALRASCAMSLAAHGLMDQITQLEADTTPDRPFPIFLVPLYTFFFQNDEDAAQQIDVNNPRGEDGKRMWSYLLSNGPLVNLTMLANAIRSAENASPECLSLCWKTLNLLVKQLGIAPTEISESTQRRFNSEHDETRKYVQQTERGFRVAPMLDIFNIVVRGRRISSAFSGHPEYYSRTDVVFGKEHLRHGDLLEGFAHCLPDYIDKLSPEDGCKFMEGIVCNDHLWTSLQVNLWDIQRTNLPTADKLHDFEDCCTVLDAALSSLENSMKMDWRAPEFGSLTQQFESFIARSFQGTFMKRATSFRIAVIRARSWKVLLSQFCGDIERDGTIYFRSQWDVASLARLFWSLGVGDGKDAEFWMSYSNGGHIDEEFKTKVYAMMDRAARDGPLLIFCKLIRLATTAVPFRGSGLENRDLTKLWELQKNMKEDQRLPLNRASDGVWQNIRGLRVDVHQLLDKMRMPDKEEDWLQLLLGTIDDILYPGSDELGSSGLGEPQVPEFEALRLHGPRGSVDRRSFSSESTVVAGGKPGIILAGEDGFRVPSANEISDLAKITRASLPASHNDDSHTGIHTSSYSMIQNVTAGGITEPIIGVVPLSTSPVNPDFSYTRESWDTGQARALPAYAPSRRSTLGPGTSRLVPATHTATLLKSRSKPLPTVLPRSMTSSPLVPSEFSDMGRSGTSLSLAFGVDEDE